MSQHIGFSVGTEEFAVPILVVQEIIRPTSAVKLPHTPDYVIGLINLRGKTIPVIDLKEKLAITENGHGEDGKVLVINMGQLTFGCKVDAIMGVMDISEDMIETKVDLLGNSGSDCINGIANIDENKMVMLIDFPKLLSIEDISLLSDQILDSELSDDGKVIVTTKRSGMGGDMLIREVREAMEKDADLIGLSKEAVEKIMDEVQKLLDALSGGDFAKAEEAVLSLSNYSEREIFSELGKTTRKLHDSLNEFKSLVDPKLSSMAKEDMPEATDKLEWVISKTDEAANKAISISERNLSLHPKLLKSLEVIEKRFSSLRKKSGEEKEALTSIRDGITGMNNDFMEIILAQEFQDITGQILKKVIKLVSEMEEHLVNLIKIFGVKVEPKKFEEMAGPQIKADEETLSNQDDVDSLLSEFGF